MNALTRWDPLREVEDLFSLWGRPATRKANGKEALALADWAPLVDITEDDKEYLVKAELPELKREDIKLSVENGVLTITGERKMEKEEKGKKYHRVERAYGRFERSFTLPEDASADKVNAQFKDGVLNVHIAKTDHPKAKSIDIKVN